MAHKTVPNKIELDAIAWKILEALQQNARMSFAELGRKIGLSTPAVAERVHRLEEAGVITGYHASLDSAKLGVPIRVLVRLTIPGGELQISRTVSALKELSEISRCHRITGRRIVRHRSRCGFDPAPGGADRQALGAGRDLDIHRSVVSGRATRPPGEADRVIREVSFDEGRSCASLSEFRWPPK